MRVLSQDHDGLRFRIELDDLTVHADTSSGRPVTRLSSRDALFLVSPDSHAVLVQTIELGIPAGCTVYLRELSRTAGQRELAPPAPPSGVDRADPGILAETRPGARLADSGWLRQQRIQRVNLTLASWHKGWNVLESAEYELAFRHFGGTPAATAPPVAESTDFQEVLDARLLNPEQARGWQSRNVEAAPVRTTHPAFAGDQVYKLGVERDGVYKVTTEYLQARGVPVDAIESTRLALWKGDTQVPLLVRDGNDGRMDPGDYFLFHGEERRGEHFPKSFFGPLNNYFLSWEQGSSRRYLQDSDQPGNQEPTRSFVQERLYEQNRIWGLLKDVPEPPEEADHWFWQELSTIGGPGQITLNLSIPHPVADSLVVNRIQYTCRGRTAEDLTTPSNPAPDHHLIFRLNDVFAGDLQYRYEEEAVSADWPLPPGLLANGNNSLSVELPVDHGNSYDLNYLNRIRLSYLREIRLENGQLTVPVTEASFSEPAFVRVLEVQGVNGRLLAFSDDRYLAGAVQVSDNVWHVPVPPGASVIHLVDETSFLEPDGLAVTANQDLKSTSNQADMLILAPREYLADLASLVEYHEQFRSVELVDVDAVYNEFDEGGMSTASVHSFLQYAFAHWQAPLPSYLLLVGKASNANLQEVGGGQLYYTQVPTDWVWTSPYGATATDEEFSYLVGGPDDRFQDLMIGRISVANRQQLQGYLEKHRQYREREVKGPWMETSLFCADNGDPDFEWGNDYVAGYLVPPEQRVKQIHVRSNSIYYGGAVEFIDQFNSGSLVNSYNGHGNVGIYASEALFRATDIRFLNNRGKYPICYAWSCLVGYYDDPDSMSMAELLVRQPNAGAIAFYGAAAKALIAVDNPLVINYYARFYDPNVRTFGQGVLLTEMTMKAIAGGDNITQMYNLLGDPALEPAFPRQKLNTSVPWLTAASGQTLQVQVTGEPAGMTGTLRAELWLEGRRGVNVGSAAAVSQISFSDGATVSLTVPATVPATESHRGVLRLAMDTATDRAIGQVPVFINSSVPAVFSHSPSQGVGGQPMHWTLQTTTDTDSVWLHANVSLPGGFTVSNYEYRVLMTPDGTGEWTYTLPNMPSNPATLNSPDHFTAFRMGLVSYDFTLVTNAVEQHIPGGMITLSTQEGLEVFSDSLYLEGTADSTRIRQRFSINTLGAPETAVVELRDLTANQVVVRDSIAVGAGANVWDRSLAIDAGPRNLRLTTGPVYDTNGRMTQLLPHVLDDSFILMTPAQGTGGRIALDAARFSLQAAPGALGQVVQVDSGFVASGTGALASGSVNTGLAPLVLDDTWPGVLELTPRTLQPSGLADTRPARVSCDVDSSSGFRSLDGTVVTAADSPQLALGRWNPARGLWVMQATEVQATAGGLRLEAPLHPQGGLHLPFRVEDTEGPVIQVDVNGQWFAPGDRVPRAPVFQITLSDPAGIDLGDGPFPPRVTLDGNLVDDSDLQVNDSRTAVLVNWTPGELEAGSQHSLRVEAADVLGNTGIEELDFTVASRMDIRFFANHPNPFAAQTVFAWELTDAPRALQLQIYTSAGRKVRTIDIPFPRIGYDEFTWDGTDDKGRELANGVYYLRMKATDVSGTVEGTYKLARLQ